MSKLVNRLLNFLENATPEQLEGNWKQLEKYSNVGPNAITIKKLLKNTDFLFIILYNKK